MKIRRFICISIVAVLMATAFGQTGRLDPKIRKFIEELNAKGGEPIYQLSPADARKVLETLQSQPVRKLDAKIEDLTIPGGPATDENDVLRDEGEAYADKMMQAGVSVTALRYLGAIHDFVMLNAISNTAEARSAIQLANMNLRNALAGAGATLGSRRPAGAAAQRR